ncbi:MAG: DUF418 domain-containing protein [Pseudomonadota bacterium]
MSKERIGSLDFLRGLAVLGMLVANVPWHVGDSMSRVHDPDWSSVTAWILQYSIFDQRFMPIFAMLFGASLYLLVGTSSKSSAFDRYFLRRMGILLGLGLAHAYLLWPGDILITYAVCGPFLLLAFRHHAWTLVGLGLALNALNLAFGEWPGLYERTIERVLFSWWVDYGEAPSTIAEAYAGSYSDLLQYNAWRNQFIQWTALPYFRVWNALGLMLIGMGLFRLGVLQGNRPKDFYKKLLAVSISISIPLVTYGVFARIGRHDAVGSYLGFIGDLPLENITFRSGCAVMSLGIIAAVHLVYDRLAKRVRAPVEAVGRMALTNYLLHSVLFLIIMHGFKLIAFDSLDHDHMLALVFLVWALQLTWSSPWLSRFRQGPVEALWRRLCGPKPQ